MNIRTIVSQILRGARVGMVSLAALQLSVGPGLVAAATAMDHSGGRTATPIKHVIVIIGENRSFDHVFATYVPQRGQTVHNLLSQGIIKLDANKNAIPGPNFNKAQQLSATDMGGQDTFLLNPPKQEFPNNQLPFPEVGGPSGANGNFTPSSAADTTVKCGTTTVNGVTTTNFLTPAACAAITENGLPDATDANGLTFIQSLASGGTLQESDTPDVRIANFGNLPAGPFQLTNGTTTTNYLTPAACAAVTENGLPDATDANGLTYYQSLAAGGTGQYSYTPDLRIANFDSLPAGPFQLTNGTNSATPGYSLTYTDYTASPVHRFYQMWQQLNCSIEQASFENPSGCSGNLFSWVDRKSVV